MIGDELDNNCDGVVDGLTDDDKDGNWRRPDDTPAWFTLTRYSDNGIDEDCNTLDTGLGDHPNGVYVNQAAAADGGSQRLLSQDTYLASVHHCGGYPACHLVGPGYFLAEGDTCALGLTVSIYGGYAFDPNTLQVNWGTLAGGQIYGGCDFLSGDDPGSRHEPV